jgi:galactokinase
MLERLGVVGTFQRVFPDAHARGPRVFSAPGRVNLIGEHTDYNEGYVLPLAIEQRTWMAAAPRDDRVLRVHSADAGPTREVHLDEPGARSGTWLDYVEGTARVLEQRGLRLRGADITISSDIPRGAGLSSSAALEVCAGFALGSLSDRAEPDRLTLALAGQQAEHEWVGTKCGLMDQYITAFARPGHAVLLDCRSLQGVAVPLALKSACVLAIDSRVKHDLATSAYNERRSQCDEGVRAMAAASPGIKALRDVSPQLLASLADRLDPVVMRRCRHVVTENPRTLEAVDAFGRGDLPRVGALMVKSHESLRDDYEVSCAELDFLVEQLCALAGVYGARMTGGGFGGCVIGLVERDAVASVVERVTAAYERTFGKAPQAFVTQPSEGAREDLR